MEIVRRTISPQPFFTLKPAQRVGAGFTLARKQTVWAAESSRRAIIFPLRESIVGGRKAAANRGAEPAAELRDYPGPQNKFSSRCRQAMNFSASSLHRHLVGFCIDKIRVIAS
jgi:hypothetical protein